MYLDLNDDNWASFHYNKPKKNETEKHCFKINPLHQSRIKIKDPLISYCFETDCDPKMRFFLEQFGVVMNEADVSKLRFSIFQNGDIGPCS